MDGNLEFHEKIYFTETSIETIQEQWRCLGQGRGGESTAEEYYDIVPKHLLDDNCPMINATWCTKPESDYYPVPCKFLMVFLIITYVYVS